MFSHDNILYPRPYLAESQHPIRHNCDSVLNPEFSCLRSHQWSVTYLITLSDWIMSSQPGHHAVVTSVNGTENTNGLLRNRLMKLVVLTICNFCFSFSLTTDTFFFRFKLDIFKLTFWHFVALNPKHFLFPESSWRFSNWYFGILLLWTQKHGHVIHIIQFPTINQQQSLKSRPSNL